MSAPSIPNLLSSRGHGQAGGPGRASQRGLGPGRGRGRGGTSAASALSHDATIQGTDTDAAVSRLSAVDLAYLDDPFASYFVPSPDAPPARRLPIINRGTYTRTSALDALVDSFLAAPDAESAGLTATGPADATPRRQIVSLGAGTDTRALRLFDAPGRRGLVYHEIDYGVVCDKKLRTVRATPSLAGILTNSSVGEDGSWHSQPVHGGEYHCHGLDLRQLAGSADSPASPTSPASPAIYIPGLRTDIPTLILSECCLCYLSPSEASQVIDYFSSRIANLAVAIYEPIQPDDAFGQMMVSNLAARNISMPTVDVYRDGKAQEARLRQAGFETVRHMTIEDIWEQWIAPEERERVDGLEGLDEVEEWKLLAAHYVVVWAYKGVGFGCWDSFRGRP